LNRREEWFSENIRRIGEKGRKVKGRKYLLEYSEYRRREKKTAPKFTRGKSREGSGIIFHGNSDSCRCGPDEEGETEE